MGVAPQIIHLILGFSTISHQFWGTFNQGKWWYFINLNHAAIWGWFPLLTTIPGFGRSKVLMIYPHYINNYLMTIKSSKSSNGKSIWFPNHPNHQLCSIYFTRISGIFHYKPSTSGIFHYKPEFRGFSTRISTIISGYPQWWKATRQRWFHRLPSQRRRSAHRGLAVNIWLKMLSRF